MPTDSPVKKSATLALGACALALLTALSGCATLAEPEADASAAVRADDSAAKAAPESATQQSATARLQRAIQLAQPRQSNLGRARTLLDGILAANDEEARSVHVYARALLDQINERQRLTANNERLTQQLDGSARQLREIQQQRDDIQRKLDALAEIERSLSPRSAPLPAERAQ